MDEIMGYVGFSVLECVFGGLTCPELVVVWELVVAPCLL